MSPFGLRGSPCLGVGGEGGGEVGRKTGERFFSELRAYFATTCDHLVLGPGLFLSYCCCKMDSDELDVHRNTR